jgi:hypothetical protein
MIMSFQALAHRAEAELQPGNDQKPANLNYLEAWQSG